MRSLGKLLIACVMMIVFSSLAYAVAFSVNVTSVDNLINITSTAKYRIELNNYLSTEQVFRIYSLDYPVWDIYTVPLQNPIIVNVAPGSKESIELIINPMDKKNIQTGNHVINLKIESKTTGQVISYPLGVTILSKESLIGGYVPTVMTGLKIPKIIDPREKFNIEISLSNQNKINYSLLSINMESRLINGIESTSLEPQGERTIILQKSLDYLTSPGEDTLKVYVFYGERQVSSIETDFEIMEFVEREDSPFQRTFLRDEKEIKVRSNNPYYSQEIKEPLALFKSFFVTTKPKAKILKEENKRYLVWDIRLENNYMTVKVIYDYRPLFILMIITILAIGGYFYLRSPMVISKNIAEVKRHEGGISSMKIVLDVKNRSQKRIEAIEIEERIPNIGEVEKDLYIGTMSPSKILHNANLGSIVKWNIPAFEPGEERVIAYKIKAKLPILGEFSLEPAFIKFRHEKGNRVSRSNRVNS